MSNVTISKVGRKYVILTLLIHILGTAPGAVMPFLNALLIDKYISVDNKPLGIFIAVIVGLATIIVIRALTRIFETLFLGYFHTKVTLEAKNKIYKKTHKLKINEFDVNNSGFFYSRLTRDVESYSMYKALVPFSMFGIILTFCINLGFVFYYSWQIGLGAIGLSLFMLLFMLFQTKKVMKFKFKKIREKTDVYNTFLSNSFNGIREIKNFNLQESEFERYRVISNEFRMAWQDVHKSIAKIFMIFFFVTGTLSALILIIGTWQINNNMLTIGSLSAITAYSSRIIEPITQLIRSINDINRGNVSKGRIKDLLSKEEENVTGNKIDITDGMIEFKNVSLKYNEKTTALKNISMKIKPGEHVAIVGSTGSGKSTLLKALVRHYDVTDGSIEIDNNEIQDVNVEELRKSITYVSQEGYLTNDSVKVNVLFSNNHATNNKIYDDALSWSDSKNFIENLEDKDETIVGPEGVKLSGGQKQRITIARAFVKNSKIILFDESTSALDNSTERKIQNSINDWIKDKTTITVAHRLSTIIDSDRIFVMEEGSIVEEGNHSELMNKQGKYYDLVNASII